MLNITGTTITLTRGDTAKIQLTIMKDGSRYELESGDTVRFALKRKEYKGVRYSELVDAEPLINKSVPTDTLILQIDPADTKDLLFGEYLYDIELTMNDGTVDTFIADSIFRIATEVH